MVGAAAVALNWLEIGWSVHGDLKVSFGKDVERERAHLVLNNMNGLVSRKG